MQMAEGVPHVVGPMAAATLVMCIGHQILGSVGQACGGLLWIGTVPCHRLLIAPEICLHIQVLENHLKMQGIVHTQLCCD